MVNTSKPTILTTQSGTVLDEVEQVFDIEENIYLIVADISWIAGIGMRGFRRAGGVGTDRWNGGYRLISERKPPLVPSERGWVVTAHELGHAFGLCSTTSAMMRTSCRTVVDHTLYLCAMPNFLAVHPYFNPNVNPARRRQPNHRTHFAAYLSDRRKERPKSNSKSGDSEGLHQAILFAQTIPPHFSAGHPEVKAVA